MANSELDWMWCFCIGEICKPITTIGHGVNMKTNSQVNLSHGSWGNCIIMYVFSISPLLYLQYSSCIITWNSWLHAPTSCILLVYCKCQDLLVFLCIITWNSWWHAPTSYMHIACCSILRVWFYNNTTALASMR